MNESLELMGEGDVPLSFASLVVTKAAWNKIIEDFHQKFFAGVGVPREFLMEDKPVRGQPKHMCYLDDATFYGVIDPAAGLDQSVMVQYHPATRTIFGVKLLPPAGDFSSMLAAPEP